MFGGVQMANDYENLQRYAKLTAFGTDGSVLYESDPGLRIRFEISKSVKASPNHCSVMVYGVAKDDAEAIIIRTSRIELVAGDNQDTAGPIFRGAVVDGYYKDNESPYMELTALDGDSFYGSWISQSIGAGETLAGLVRKAAAYCSSPIAIGGISPSASAIRLPRGCSLFGSTIDVIENVAKAINAAWYINDEMLYILTDSDMKNGNAFTVDVEDDLVGVPVMDAWTCAFSHVIDSRVILGTTCTFDDAETAVGVFRIVTLDIIGDTRDGEWRMNVWALRQDNNTPTMTALTRNIWR